MAPDPASAGSLFFGLPVIIWSGIVAAGMTVIGTIAGVIVTNWANTKRLKIQLKHDAEQKATERVALMRRDLYMKAADANVRVMAYLGSLPKTDLTSSDAAAPMNDMQAVAAQLQLVSSQETAQLVGEVSSALGELMLRLTAKALPIQLAQADVTIRNQHYENYQTEIRRVLAAMTQYNESGADDPARFERLDKSFDFATEQSEKIANERAAHYQKVLTLQRQYAKDSIPEVSRLSELQMQLLVALRKELDVGADIEVFQRMMRTQLEKATRVLQEFDAEIEKLNAADD